MRIQARPSWVCSSWSPVLRKSTSSTICVRPRCALVPRMVWLCRALVSANAPNSRVAEQHVRAPCRSQSPPAWQAARRAHRAAGRRDDALEQRHDAGAAEQVPLRRVLLEDAREAELLHRAFALVAGRRLDRDVRRRAAPLSLSLSLSLRCRRRRARCRGSARRARRGSAAAAGRRRTARWSSWCGAWWGSGGLSVGSSAGLSAEVWCGQTAVDQQSVVNSCRPGNACFLPNED